MIYFTLYSRSYCHLCDDMREALQKLLEHVPHQIIMRDVDQDPELLKMFDELVPVLFAKRLANSVADSVADSADDSADDSNLSDAGQQLCHYFLDTDKVKAFCDE